ncbi:MAG: hypothetical protein R3C45_06665 [Phycisphaerales bacterium]
MGFIQPDLIGDLDGDVCSNADLNIVLAAWNQNVTMGQWGEGDPGDGFVGIEDLNMILATGTTGPTEHQHCARTKYDYRCHLYSHIGQPETRGCCRRSPNTGRFA